MGIEKEENKEMVLLNDLRWTPEMISWFEFLNLLEGQILDLTAPTLILLRTLCYITLYW